MPCFECIASTSLPCTANHSLTACRWMPNWVSSKLLVTHHFSASALPGVSFHWQIAAKIAVARACAPVARRRCGWLAGLTTAGGVACFVTVTVAHVGAVTTAVGGLALVL